MLSLESTIAWYVFLIVMVWSFQRLTRCFTQLNIFSLFLAFLVLRHGITVPFDHDVNEWYAGISLQPRSFDRFYTSLVVMWLCLLVGAWLGRLMFGRGVLNVATLRHEMTSRRITPGMSQPLFLVALGISVGLVMVYQLRFDVGLLQLLSGKLTAVDYYDMRASFGAATHWTAGVGERLASIARFGLFPFFICTLYFMRERGLLWRVLFWMVLGLGLVVGLLSGQKTASVFLVIGVVVAAYLRAGRLTLRLSDWRIWALAAVGWFGVLPYLYHLQYPDEDYARLLGITSYRISSEYDRSLQLYFEVYPDIQPHLYGHSSALINTVLGTPVAADMLPERFIPTYYIGSNYENTWNACFVGVAWVDFGYAGVALESMFVGLLLQGYARWFLKARKTALVMGTQVGLMMAATRLSEVALTSALLSFGLLSTFLMFYVVRRHVWQPQPRGVELQVLAKLVTTTQAI